ncbi:11377_t:CDS:10 [Paraglomus brasilianum]|uniref:Flap endonuclease 1 n=1 Tax=Paraglomus brasilianum TaxID=144538 RepID=A0A9N9BA54_9GLOM|nr:11377_t:CDS:10 [Paraglomus brasilianum]
MGIHNLHKVIADHAAKAISANEIKSYFGRKVAIDASMSIYQFLIAVRQADGQQLTSDTGETTSHLMGMFYRTIRMVENGIKPVYVFDGKPPMLKSGELAKRLERRKEANKNLEEAHETGAVADIDKYSRRTVKVTPEHNAECKKLLKLMGIPYIDAPCEAEAQCAALARAGKVYAAASEDMDTLTFNAPMLLRHLTFTESRKMPIDEIHLDKALEGLELNIDEVSDDAFKKVFNGIVFACGDLCILLGCDYCDSIKGIGPHRAYELIKKHRNLETIIKELDPKKYPIPEDWHYKEARELFRNPDVVDPNTVDIKWNTPDVEAVVDFLVREKAFSEERVRKGVDKIMKNIKAATQVRLDSFFTAAPTKDTPKKRKAEETATNKNNGKATKKRRSNK